MSIDAQRAIDTKRVGGRRKVRYRSYQEILDDAHRLAAGPHRSLGNWSLGQVLKHLGNAMQGSVDGQGFPVKWYLRWLGPIVIKPRLIKGPFPAGFRLPLRAAEKLVARDTTTFDEGMAALLAGIERLQRETSRASHPVAGRLTIDEWDQFHLRHAEMHMSFVVPEEGEAGVRIQEGVENDRR